MDKKQKLVRKNTNLITKSGTAYYQKWTCAPAYLAPYMPQKEEPGRLYLSIRWKMIDDVRKADHDDLISLMERYQKALPSTTSDYSAYLGQIMKQMT